ncbi:MAG: phosphoenolpyruvate--protein phosphotransferase [Spirochaetaceae bacterium]|nr:phosphoenolpyruvate--protein phosphotransferase [Spirochaetaceae bacterium]
MEVYKGLAISDGIGLGQVFVVPEIPIRHIPQRQIEPADMKKEWQRLEDALKTVHSRIKSKLKGAKSSQEEILQTYIVMLEDVEFIKQVKTMFSSTKMNVEFVLNEKVTEMANMLRAANDDYLSERAADISDIFGQVIDEILGYEPFDFQQVPEDVIVVAESISAADAVILLRRNMKALVVTEGGISSHLAILSRNAQVPAVFGILGVTQKFSTGNTAIVNGTEGIVVVAPDEMSLKEFKLLEKAETERKAKLDKMRKKPAISVDGVEFGIYANIGLPEEAKKALDEGADGIGLFRTEFLFMGAVQSAKNAGSSSIHSVTEEAQFVAYRQVLEIMGKKPVTIRTLDTGGDKLIKEAGIPMPVEQNPLLGSRAIRLTLAHKNLFKRQLRALFRASVYGNLRIMLPLITHLSQVQEALQLIKEVKYELSAEKISFKKDVPIGIMVETAAAGIVADLFAKQVDFFSVGTNDLTQYTLGIDRENTAVASLYDEHNIAVLRLIKHTVESAKTQGIPLTVCGEMAGNPEDALLLAGMGVRSFSMSVARFPSVKAALASHTIEELEEKAALSLNSNLL